MSLGPVMLDLAGPALDAEDRELLRHPQVGGVILFSRNFEDREQLRALCLEIHALREPRLLVAVDHEGGRVQRFREGFTAVPPMAAIGALHGDTPEQALALARCAGRVIAEELIAVGVDLALAPVVDLDRGESAVIGDRAFHRDPAVTAALARALMDGMAECGMAAVAKHFPGHGAVIEDSHHELPTDPRALIDMEEDLQPFRRLIAHGLRGIMTAHLAVPAVDAVPVSCSRIWLEDLLRRELGFTGAVFSDDLSMKAMDGQGDAAARAHAALAAGCDMILVCNDRPAAVAVIGSLGDERWPAAQLALIRLHGDPQRLGSGVAADPERHAADVAALIELVPQEELPFR